MANTKKKSTATGTKKTVDVDPRKYPTVKTACENFRALMASEGENANPTDAQAKAQWRVIFAAAQTDGLIGKDQKYEDYHEFLNKDLSDLLIEPNEDSDDGDIMELLAQMGAA